jgi:hypothetical protein
MLPSASQRQTEQDISALPTEQACDPQLRRGSARGGAHQAAPAVGDALGNNPFAIAGRRIACPPRTALGGFSDGPITERRRSRSKPSHRRCGERKAIGRCRPVM